MVIDKSPPPLRGRSSTPYHSNVIFNSGLRELDPELQELAMDTWRAPPGIRSSDLPDKTDSFSRSFSATMTARKPPVPVEAETLSLPINDGLGLDELENAPPVGDRFSQPKQDRSVPSLEEQALLVTLQYAELITEQRILPNEGAASAKLIEKDTEKDKYPKHRGTMSTRSDYVNALQYTEK